MQVKCPNCGYAGNIKDELIPDTGRNVNCPKCKGSFLVRKPDVIQDNASLKKDTFTKPKVIIAPKKASASVDIRGLLIPILIAIVFLGIGFFGGYSYHKSKYSISESGKTESDGSVRKPNLNDSKEAVTPPTAPQPEPPLDQAQPTIEEMTSDTYTDIAQIDTKALEWHNSELTGLQKEDAVKKYGGSVLGTNLKGYLKVLDVRSSIYTALLEGMNDRFPDRTYKYVIEAENLYPVSETTITNTKVLLGLKGNEDFLQSLKKGSKIYAEGIIYAYMWYTFDSYEINLVNCKVNIVE